MSEINNRAEVKPITFSIPKILNTVRRALIAYAHMGDQYKPSVQKERDRLAKLKGK